MKFLGFCFPEFFRLRDGRFIKLFVSSHGSDTCLFVELLRGLVSRAKSRAVVGILLLRWLGFFRTHGVSGGGHYRAELNWAMPDCNCVCR